MSSIIKARTLDLNMSLLSPPDGDGDCGDDQKTELMMIADYNNRRNETADKYEHFDFGGLNDSEKSFDRNNQTHEINYSSSTIALGSLSEPTTSVTPSSPPSTDYDNKTKFNNTSDENQSSAIMEIEKDVRSVTVKDDGCTLTHETTALEQMIDNDMYDPLVDNDDMVPEKEELTIEKEAEAIVAEMETCLHEMQMLSVQNAILMDSLTIAGANM